MASRAPLNQLAWASAGLIVISFYCLPWVNLQLVKRTKLEGTVEAAAKKSLKGVFKTKKSGFWSKKRRKAPIIPSTITGADIPTVANSKSAKTASDLRALLTGSREQFGLISYAVYSVPILSIIFAIVLTRGSPRRRVAVPIAAVCGIIAVWGVVTILTANLRQHSLVVGVGLWATLLGYALLGFTAMAGISPPVRERMDRIWARLLGALQRRPSA